jgi:hypothetical protein
MEAHQYLFFTLLTITTTVYCSEGSKSLKVDPAAPSSITSEESPDEETHVKKQLAREAAKEHFISANKFIEILRSYYLTASPTSQKKGPDLVAKYQHFLMPHK